MGLDIVTGRAPLVRGWARRWRFSFSDLVTTGSDWRTNKLKKHVVAAIAVLSWCFALLSTRKPEEHWDFLGDAHPI
jgi:hypothetical protein